MADVPDILHDITVWNPMTMYWKTGERWNTSDFYFNMHAAYQNLITVIW